MANTKQGGGLQILFSIFLGLMLTALVGVGIYTFHSPPDQLRSEIRELERKEQAIRNTRPDNELTTADRDQIKDVVRQRNELVDTAERARKQWALRTSIILFVFATVAMAVSLVRTEKAPVISNGLLLGGVFGMLYAVGWIATADTSVTRFLIMTAAFLTTLGLGYARFARRGKVATPALGSGIPAESGIADIDRRLCDLEQRMDDASRALAHRHDSSNI